LKWLRRTTLAADAVLVLVAVVCLLVVVVVLVLVLVLLLLLLLLLLLWSVLISRTCCLTAVASEGPRASSASILWKKSSARQQCVRHENSKGAFWDTKYGWDTVPF
jgi:hypothetical protein